MTKEGVSWCRSICAADLDLGIDSFREASLVGILYSRRLITAAVELLVWLVIFVGTSFCETGGQNSILIFHGQ